MAKKVKRDTRSRYWRNKPVVIDEKVQRSVKAVTGLFMFLEAITGKSISVIIDESKDLPDEPPLTGSYEEEKTTTIE